MGLILVVLASTQIKEITSPTGSEVSYNLYNKNQIVHSKPYESMASQFGIHEFAGSLTGRLVVIKGDDFLCTYEKESDIPSEKKEWISHAPDSLSAFGNILLIERGKADTKDNSPCVFTKKVKLAEELGAKAAIIWDNREEKLFTMWDPDEVFGSPIKIPSVLVTKATGMELLKVLTAGKWTESSRYEHVDSLQPMTVTVRWGLPHPDGTVELDYYTCADDFKSMSFKANFPEVISGFGDKLTFTPHYYFMNGWHIGCRGSGDYCGKRCANSGRYCVEDPHKDTVNGISGFEVLEENLRQICVWKHQKEQSAKGKEDQEKETQHWFKYVDLFNNNCLGDTEKRKVDSEKFHANCSKTQMDKVDVTMWKSVEKCIADSGGLALDLDKENPLFEAELKIALTHEIISCPQVAVNNFRLNNRWDCPSKVSINTCETFRSICAGFESGTTPSICGGSPGCPAGEYIDSCQICWLKSDPRFDASCVDCAGFINGLHKVQLCPFGKEVCAEPGADFEKSCKSICKWNAFDACGKCTDPSSPGYKDPKKYPNAVFDCNGECAGSAVNDCSQTCGGTKITYCDDCIESKDPRIGLSCEKYKDCHSGIVDACGDCVKSSSDKYLKPSEHPGAKKDCSGVCGGSMIDHCGRCLESSDPKGGIPCFKLESCKSDLFDACADCVEPGTSFVKAEDFPNAKKDCAGVCLGNKAIYCGFCLERDDPLVGKDCNSVKEKLSTGGSKGGSKSQLAMILSIVCVLIIVVSFIIYFMWNRMNKQEQQFRRLMSEYTLLDDNQDP